jgi:hypothetical protein
MSYVYDPDVNYELTYGNNASWIATIWKVLDVMSPDSESYTVSEDEWDEICTAMAWIQAEIGVGNITDFPECDRND